MLCREESFEIVSMPRNIRDESFEIISHFDIDYTEFLSGNYSYKYNFFNF